jgi:GT2 family glycosyltransferase
MPFAGPRAAAEAAVEALLTLEIRDGDELILVDNSGTGAAGRATPPVHVVTAGDEASPARARNVGARAAANEWILFLDADVRPSGGLLGAFFAGGIADDVGAVAGEIVAAPEVATLAGRYGAARGFLGQRAHFEHPYRPRAAAANLLVRRAAFEQLGGFYEGVRAAEDTDFTWRLQEAGWKLALRGEAQVEHRYRTTLAELRRQWRGYAAGRAWLARRYDGFVPEPAARRFLRRAAVRWPMSTASAVSTRGAPPVAAGALERGSFAALDAVLAAEELAGLTLSNRPRRHPSVHAGVVLIADRFPVRDDPLVELAQAVDDVRVEALARPLAPDVAVGRRVRVDYLEDDGQLARLGALATVALRHPVRTTRDLLLRSPGALPLHVLAPAVRRLERDRQARLHCLGAGRGRDLAERLGRLVGRPLEG